MVDSWKKAIEVYKRSRKLQRNKINPILVIFSPRDIPMVKEAFKKIDFVDKLWIKYFPSGEAYEQLRQWLKDKGYTHIIIQSDDVTPTPETLKILLNDILEYDFLAIAGCCNYCDVWGRKPYGICKYCRDEVPHDLINITFDPVKYKDRPITLKSYNFITEEWRRNHPEIRQVWFQGIAFGVIRRDIYDSVGLYPRGETDTMFDLEFAISLSEYGIPQFCDFRAFMRHWGLFHGQLQVGKKKSKLIFIQRRREMT